MQQMHKAKDRGKRADPSFYLIQFHSLRLEAEHVDGKVVVLLLQQHHPKKKQNPADEQVFLAGSPEALFPADAPGLCRGRAGS